MNDAIIQRSVIQYKIAGMGVEGGSVLSFCYPTTITVVLLVRIHTKFQANWINYVVSFDDLIIFLVENDLGTSACNI